jgi:DNA-binding MarR family transcriptional regulator
MIIDKRAREILKYFLAEKSNESYKLLSKQDILAALPEKMTVDANVLNSILGALEVQELITTKFNDDEEICVKLTPKGFTSLQKDAELIREKAKAVPITKKTYAILGAVCFVAAFLGVIVGELISKLF